MIMDLWCVYHATSYLYVYYGVLLDWHIPPFTGNVSHILLIAFGMFDGSVGLSTKR